MTLDTATILRIAKAYGQLRDLVDSGDLAGLKDDVEALGHKITAKIGPKENGEHYSLDDIKAITDEGRANFTEAIDRSKETE